MAQASCTFVFTNHLLEVFLFYLFDYGDVGYCWYQHPSWRLVLFCFCMLTLLRVNILLSCYLHVLWLHIRVPLYFGLLRYSILCLCRYNFCVNILMHNFAVMWLQPSRFFFFFFFYFMQKELFKLASRLIILVSELFFLIFT